MRTVDHFPHTVRKTETAWIPMSDGTRLAATIWVPESASQTPVPALLEYIPYRRRDMMAVRDSMHHPYFAGHGYAAVRVDMRGSGDSGGVLRDEYLPLEQQDGLEILRWLAEQAWCDGNVGMIGISWGGFNGLQIAALQPPELKAVIAVASTDDRYADDVHHMGGCLLGDNLSWASIMFAYNSLPPDPDVVGERWREEWMKRLEQNEPWLDIWLRHQRRDGYWRHGSICEDYSAVQCPVMLVSGWADGYSNAVFRMLENLDVPRKGLVGPWGHRYPHMGIPGPAIDFLQECTLWWDKWLKGIDNGVDREPMLRVWMQDSVTPTANYIQRPGRWVAESEWPSPNIREQVLPVLPHRLGDVGQPPGDGSVTIQSPLAVGFFAGKWCSYGAGPDLAHDQRRDDGGALVFESEPLREPLEILGAPILSFEFSVDRPIAMVAARISDVRENGEATRITYGLLNLTHRESNRRPSSLEPGRRYRATLRLNEAAHSFPAGNRLRLSISTSYWPLVWAPPGPVTLAIHCAGTTLTLPERAPRPDDGALRPMGEAAAARPLERSMLESESHDWCVFSNLATDTLTLHVIDDRGSYHLTCSDLVVKSYTEEKYSCRGNDFLSLRGETWSVRELSRQDWNVRTETRTVLTSTEKNFVLQADLDAYERGKRIFCRSWQEQIPRDFV